MSDLVHVPARAAQIVDFESARLDQLEAVVAEGIVGFVRAGLALTAIHDRGLYKLREDSEGKAFRSFEAYLNEHWNMSRQHGYRLMDAADVVVRLSPMGDSSALDNERKARALGPLRDDPEKAREVLDAVGPDATAAAITAEVKRVTTITETTTVDAETGEIKPAEDEPPRPSDASPAAEGASPQPVDERGGDPEVGVHAGEAPQEPPRSQPDKPARPQHRLDADARGAMVTAFVRIQNADEVWARATPEDRERLVAAADAIRPWIDRIAALSKKQAKPNLTAMNGGRSA